MAAELRSLYLEGTRGHLANYRHRLMLAYGVAHVESAEPVLPPRDEQAKTLRLAIQGHPRPVHLADLTRPPLSPSFHPHTPNSGQESPSPALV